MIEMEELKMQYLRQSEEMELLSMENETLKNDIENVSVGSVDSLASKASKYPEVECPHFLNGGKCKHCIKAWKDSEKKRKKEEKGWYLYIAIIILYFHIYLYFLRIFLGF